MSQVCPRFASDPSGSLGLLFLGEQAVDGRPRAGDIGPEGPELLELVCERRRRQVVRRQGRDISSFKGSLERGAPLAEPIGSREGLVDTRRRRFLHAGREDHQDGVVARELHRRELGAVTGAELRSFGEEERHVGAKSSGQRVEAGSSQRLRPQLIREAKRGSRIGAPSAEPRRHGDSLLDVDPRRDAERPQRLAHEGVLWEAVDLESRLRPRARFGPRDRSAGERSRARAFRRRGRARQRGRG